MSRPERELRPDRSELDRFGYELRIQRKASGLSQDRLGALVHVSGDLIQRIETAERRPSREFAEQCDRVLMSGGALLAIWEQIEDLDADQVLLVVDAGGGADAGGHTGVSDFAVTSELPIWFGVRLAHLVTLTDNWRDKEGELGSLQVLLDQEIAMFDAVAPKNPDDALTLSRRQALATLAALPLTLGMSGTIVDERNLGVVGTTDLFLSRCAASITACWHLLRGSDLSTVDQTLSAYLLTLERLAHQNTVYRQAAARLASQAHRIRGIVALHRDQLYVREHHCKRALYYASAVTDASSQASALISLASTYFYGSQPARAAAVYERALELEPDMPLLQRSRVHAELSVAYGQLEREQDALRSAELAEELYPDYPEQDRSFLYAEFTPASLALEQGLAYVALAEQKPDRSYKSQAADVFARVEQMTMTQVPDRIRFEVANHQARTSVLLNDVDAFEGHIENAVNGVAILGSKQRQRELMSAWQRGREAWPRESRLKTLARRLQIGASGIGKELL